MQEPYSQTPIPPPTGGGSYRPSGPAQIRFDVIGEAWQLLKPNMGVWIPTFLIYAVIIGVVSGITSTMAGAGARAPQPGENPFAGGGGNPVVLVVGNLLQFVVNTFLTGGLYRMAINQVRGRAVSIGDMFNAGDVLPALLGASILTALATFVGFLLCIIPGLLIAGGLMFTIPLVVDQRLGALEAMSTSWNTLKSQVFMAFLFLFVVGIVASLGLLLCFVGVLITAPIGILSIALLYRDFFIGAQAPETGSMPPSVPPPPIPPATV